MVKKATVVRQKIEGELLSLDVERRALIVSPGEKLVFLSFAFRVLVAEEYIIPESILDDWGHEITGLGLYDWVRQNGERFPRAEVFGYNLAGEVRQFFVRELDFLGRYLCLGWVDETNVIRDAFTIESILIADHSVDNVKPVSKPLLKSTPICYADVDWWLFNPTGKLDLSKLSQRGQFT